MRNVHYIICAIGGHPNDKATRSGHVPNRDESHVLLVFSPSEENVIAIIRAAYIHHCDAFFPGMPQKSTRNNNNDRDAFLEIVVSRDAALNVAVAVVARIRPL